MFKCSEAELFQLNWKLTFYEYSRSHLEPLALPQGGATYGLRAALLDKAHNR
jgi:hypothetical protein